MDITNYCFMMLVLPVSQFICYRSLLGNFLTLLRSYKINAELRFFALMLLHVIWLRRKLK